MSRLPGNNILKEISKMPQPGGFNYERKEGQIKAGVLTVEIPVGFGNVVHNNVWVILTISAMSGSEVLNIYGKDRGVQAYRTAVLTTQIDIKAADEDVLAVDLSGKGPLGVLKFVASNIAASETIYINVFAW
jgi:hypothetical protein